MRIWVAMITVVTAWGANGSGKPPADGSRVVVYLEARFFSSITELAAARIQATELFKAAGIRLEWRYGHPREDAAGARVVAVKFVAETPAPFLEPPYQHAMAAACPYANGPESIMVFTDRVEDFLAPFDHRAAGKLLGHILAHEIAHVLEGIARHSVTGLMKPSWSVDDYGVMTRHGLPFAAEDVEFMRAGLLKGAGQ